MLPPFSLFYHNEHTLGEAVENKPFGFPYQCGKESSRLVDTSLLQRLDGLGTLCLFQTEAGFEKARRLILQQLP